MRVYAADYLVEHGLVSTRCLDEKARAVSDVVWIDYEAGTFGQGLRDTAGNHVIENDEWVTIERIGRLVIVPELRRGHA